jgi:Mn-containing catalase
MKFGGPNGELSAAIRYLSQRYSMPTDRTNCFFIAQKNIVILLRIIDISDNLEMASSAFE